MKEGKQNRLLSQLEKYKEIIAKYEVSFTGNKLSSCFNIKDTTKFEHRHDVIYLGTCPERTCNDNYIGAKQNDEFWTGLKTTTAETLNHTY